MNIQVMYEVTFEQWATKEDYFSIMVEGIHVADYRTLTKDRVIVFLKGNGVFI